MNSTLTALVFSLILTLAVELSVAALLRIRQGKQLLLIALANLLTNPAVNYCYYWALRFFTADNIYAILILIALEAAAVLIEFLIYRSLLSFDRFGKLKLSLILNGSSFGAGLLVSVIIKLLS